MMKVRHLAAAAMTALGISCAHAQLTTYDLILTVQSASNAAQCASHPFSDFGCLSSGQTFSGRFSIDSSILATDGINRTAAIYDLFMPFGTAIYSTGPDNTALRGFRNGMGFASAPGFLIEDGQVVDLVGGFFGAADVPFIDFFPFTARNSFSARDAIGTTASGSLRVATPVPEPETLALWIGGIFVVGVAMCRDRKKAAA